MWTCLGSYIEIEMTMRQARACTHPGDCEADVRAIMKEPNIARQLRKMDMAKARAELRGFGTWSEQELADDDMTRVRVVWIAAGNIVDEHPKRR